MKAFRNLLDRIERPALVVCAFFAMIACADAESLPRFLRNGVNMDWWVRTSDPQPVIDDAIVAKLAQAEFTHIRYAINPRVLVKQAESGFADDCDSHRFRAFLQRQIEALKPHKLGLALTIDASNDLAVLQWASQTDDGERLATMVKCMMREALAIDPVYARDNIAFGTLNEPRIDSARWSLIQSRAIASVRKVYDTPWLLAMGVHPASANQLHRVDKAPFAHVAYEVHFYEPFVFTAQGALGGPVWLRNVHGIRYGVESGHCEAIEGAGAGERCVKCDSLDSSEFCKAYRQQKPFLLSKTYIRTSFARLAEWAQGHPIYVGEYGVNRRLMNDADSASDRLAWLRSVAAESDANGFGRSIYSLGCWFGVTVHIDCDMASLKKDFQLDTAVLDAIKPNR